MSKRTILIVVSIYFFLFILNYLTPMAFGDDYVYSFIWQGHSEFEPLTETAKRISSLQDLFISQWSHYLTWSGRTVSHTIAQFFLWVGKDLFNFFNALISLLLVFEIYWCTNRGIVTFHFKPVRILAIFFVLWTFTPGFSPVFFWLSGACNYLWTAVLLLAFLLPYIRKYYFIDERYSQSFGLRFGMLFLGVLAGWSNENSICWVILALFIFVYVNRKKCVMESWMFTGLAGLIIGYALLLFAPGNVARLQVETGVSSNWVTLELIKTNLNMFSAVLCFQFLLWYFSLRSLFILQGRALNNEEVKLDKIFVQLLCILSFGMTATMLFSPNFPPRSSFPGTVQLVIATFVLLRVQEEYSMELIKKKAKKFLAIIGTIYFFLTTIVTVYGFYDYHTQIQTLLSVVNHSKQAKDEIITVPSLVPVSETVENMSGLHLLFYKMSENENDWRNVAFSRYYWIKGIRMIQRESKNQE